MPVVPFIPLIASGIGLLGKAFSKSGDQGGVNSQQQQQTNQNINKQEAGTTASNFTSPLMQSFMKQLVPQLQGAMASAQQPVYGEAQKADYLGGLDQLANASISNLQQTLARSGALNSGRMSQGATDIMSGRNASAARFFSQLPLLNQQAKTNAQQGLFSASTGLLNAAPRSGVFTDQSQTQSQGNMTGTNNQQQQGAPWWKQFLGGMGGLAGKLPGGDNGMEDPVNNQGGM